MLALLQPGDYAIAKVKGLESIQTRISVNASHGSEILLNVLMNLHWKRHFD
jgi:hypothetical protein